MNHLIKKLAKSAKQFVFLCIGIVMVVALIILGITIGTSKSKIEVTTVSTLEKIINVSELSTYTSVYKGIAEAHNEKKPEDIDYYVSYKAIIKAGIDIEEIEISVDDTEKTILIDIPEIEILDVNIDNTSFDYIFYNKKADSSGITQEAYAKCEEDLNNEIKNLEAIHDLAKQNAVTMLTALVNPIIEQLETDYTLIVD